MKIQALKTRKFLPPKDDLWELLSSIASLEERSIVVVASKVVAIGEGRTIHKKDVPEKDALIIKEADLYLPRDLTPNGWVVQTIKNNILLPSAGVDESNGNDFYILWPENSMESAEKIGRFLKNKFKVKNLGVIISDSHSVPLRRGLVGLALGFWGFNPLRDYRGSEDIFGRELKLSMTNIPDSLAAAAVFDMGEGGEQTPIAIITDLPGIEFGEKLVPSEKPYSSYNIEMDEDLYAPFLTSVPWKKGGR